MDERDRRRYNDNERDYYTNNDRVDRDPRRGDPRDYRSSGRGYSADDRRPPYDRDGYRSERENYRPEREAYRPDRDGYRSDRDYHPRDDYDPRDRADEMHEPPRSRYDAEPPKYTQTDDRKKRGIFGFGKKEDANVRNVIITYPRSYEDVSGIIDSLRSRQAIIVDFRRVAAKDTQRVLDFLSGALYALGGSQERIGDGMFLFTPEGVTIQGPLSLKRRYD
ncbi:MAG TPA: cell division protein SepF [Candidatus Ornithoclostridium faecigallinarum]|nr:cell division protein SepF [Candidatus Ornithoclostridium faecigallinarum]